MFKKSVALIIPIIFVAAGCGSGGLGGASSISLDQEWQLGNQMAAQVAQQVHLVNDPQALAYVRMVGERIHAVTPLADRPFDFEIVADPSVNAFSIPGGHVYVNTGLIAQADQADELAAVLAHEISHIVHRDVLKQVEQQQEISVVGSILLGQNPNALSQIVAQVLAGGAMARFSRANEKAADHAGLHFMTAAGYNPHGMFDLFKKLLALDQGGNGAVAQFFQDHPGTQDRINDISGRISQMGAQANAGIIDDPQYQAIRTRVA